MLNLATVYSSQVVNTALQRLGVARHADVTVKAMSGGTRRKLSVALALLGDPELVLLVSTRFVLLVGTHRVREVDCSGYATCTAREN